VCTRGSESGGRPTVYATLSPIAPAARAARTTGVVVRTLPLLVPATARAGATGLLAGAKTLSYAVNMATLRWAAAQGADDVLWTSTEGYALEAPTASVVWLDGDAICTVPPARTGVLPGITARHLLDRAGELALAAYERMVQPAELSTMDGVWLASSVRGLAEVRAIDGTPLAASPHTGRLRKLLGF